MSLRHAPWEDAAEFTIGLRAINAEGWLEGGETDPAARKDPLRAQAPELVWAETEGSQAAQLEVLEFVETALGRTIPTDGLPALYAASRQVPDDLCLMERREDGWTLTALSLSAGSFFTAEDAIGKSLAGLHGPVTGFNQRLLPRVSRIFEGLREGLVLERRNWTLLNTDVLHTPAPAPIRALIPGIAAEQAASRLFTRVERQTLRRLPRTRGVLFTIRVWTSPLEQVLAEPQRAARFAQAWRTAHPDFRAYKHLELYDHLVEPLIADL
jgi:hypothetical protein